MNFYTIDGLKELAKKKQKKICAWMPKGVTWSSNTPNHTWVYDYSAKIKEYKEILGEGKYSFKIIIHPNGIIEPIEGL